jgi:hypothetical protein
MTFDLVMQAAFQRAAEQLNADPSPEQLALILHGLAAVKEASKPRHLLHLEFTSQVNSSKPSYVFDGLGGDAQILVVNGQIIRHKFWTWNSEQSTLVLNLGYRILNGQNAEIYFIPR